MVKKLLVLLFCFYTSVVHAACPFAEAYLKVNKKKDVFGEYKVCAEQLDDSQSQFYVGKIYLNGSDFAKQDLRMAFKYFRMGSENGYAPAQRELAKLIDALEDMGSDGKQALAELENHWRSENNSSRETLSALAWMMLAAEKSENKWFYNAPVVSDEQAINLLASFKKRGNVEQAEKQAIAFKQEKLMEQAKKLLSDSAYRDFETIIYPEKRKGKGRAQMTKAQAVENLKQYKMSIQK